MKNYMKLILILIGIIALVTIPFTREAIWFILPLGSGMDDFIVIGALVLIVAIFIVANIAKKGEPLRKFGAWFKK